MVSTLSERHSPAGLEGIGRAKGIKEEKGYIDISNADEYHHPKLLTDPKLILKQTPNNNVRTRPREAFSSAVLINNHEEDAFSRKPTSEAVQTV